MNPVEVERRALAQALQNTVINQLQLLVAQANIYEQTLQQPEGRMAVSVLTSLARQALQQAFDLETRLHPTLLESLGLHPALENLGGQIERLSGMRMTLQIADVTLPTSMSLMLYRFCEAWLLHATTQGAHQARLHLQDSLDGIKLTLTRDGNSAPLPSNNAEALKASGAIYHDEGKRTQVIVKLLMQLLTEREKDVLRYLVEGMSNKEIAHKLGVRPRTIKYHLDNLYSKLGVHTRTEAVVIALNHGLTE
jgi:DNA-binding NarL/FixJ family response regulator